MYIIIFVLMFAEVASLNAKVASLAEKLSSGDQTIAAERKKVRLRNVYLHADICMYIYIYVYI